MLEVGRSNDATEEVDGDRDRTTFPDFVHHFRSKPIREYLDHLCPRSFPTTTASLTFLKIRGETVVRCDDISAVLVVAGSR